VEKLTLSSQSLQLGLRFGAARVLEQLCCPIAHIPLFSFSRITSMV
jgi:hypothetical protein